MKNRYQTEQDQSIRLGTRIDLRAERVIGIVGNVIFIFCAILAMLSLLAAVVWLISGDSASFVVGLFTAVILAFAGVVYWALLKVITNISNNLHLITDRLEKLEQCEQRAEQQRAEQQ